MSTPTATDVIVVGCGIIGASVAWRLSQRGLSVRCFDPAPGDGATYAAAGMLAPVAETGFGDDKLAALTGDSAQRWPDYARELEAESGQSVGLTDSGSLLLAFDGGDRQHLQQLLDLRRRLGLEVDDIDVARARARVPLLGPRVSAAAWAPHDRHVNPRMTHTALMTAVQRRGVEIVRKRVTSLSSTSVRDEARTTHGARWIVLAAGWQSHALAATLDGLDVPTRPVKGEIVRLSAAEHPEFRSVPVVRGFVQGRPIYVVIRPDGELIVGATSEEKADDRAVTAGAAYALLRDARAFLPGIDELPVVEMTARARPGTPDNLPLIGESAVKGVILATGHYRNGVLLAPLTAELVADAVTGESTRVDLDVSGPTRRTLPDVSDRKRQDRRGNGTVREFVRRTLTDAGQEGEDDRGVAVAVNGSVVPRSQWDAVSVRADDHVEVVTAVQGG